METLQNVEISVAVLKPLQASERHVESDHEATYRCWCELATTGGMQAFGVEAIGY